MATSDVTHASIPELVSGLVGDLKEIGAGHATKAREEIKDEFRGLKQFLVKTAISVGLGVLGAILLSHAFALGLDAMGLPQWAAYLIAAVIFVGVGALLLKRMPSHGSKDIDLIPENTFADMKRDAVGIKDDVKEGITDPGPAVHAH